MYLIDESYFINKIEIPNVSEMDSKVSVQLNQLIDEKVRLLLLNALGYELFKDLDSNITNGVLNTNAPEKWLNFVNGVEYLRDGKTVKWKGLIFTEGTNKQSLLANYTYYYWLENQVSYLSGVGEVRAETKNALNVNSTQRLTEVWNDFLKMYQGNFKEGYDYIYYRDIFYWDWCDYGHKNNEISLLQFLSDNASDYMGIETKTYRVKNQFGL